VLKGDGPHIFIDSTRIEMDSLHLGAKNNKSFKVQARGIYQPGDSVDVEASVNSFDLSLLQKMINQDITLSGMASASVEALGPLEKPVVDLKVRLDSVKARELRIKKMKLDLGHQSDTLVAKLMLQSPRGDSILLDGMAPVYFNLTDSQMVSSLKTVKGKLVAKNVRPSGFLEFEDPDQQIFKGLLNIEINAGGKLTRPVLKGSIRVDEGAVSYPVYGIDFPDLKVVANLDSNQVFVDSVFVRGEKGKMLISGNFSFDTTLVAGSFSGGDLSLKADEFFLSQHRNHEIQIDADAWLKVNDDKPEYGGDLTVLRSSFYLPAILDMGGSSEINKPLLVQAMEQSPGDSIVVEEGDTLQIRPKDRTPQTDWLKQMTGKMNVRIPRNTWVKSEDMNLELYGDFDLLKNNEYFEIFGTLGISRGYYTLYGRKLIIREGQLSFQGGQEINPRVNLKAAYQFRGKDKQKNELIMNAGGTAFEPNLSFTLSGASITERDAMAYLIFNQSFDELSFSNQEGVSGNVPSAMLSGLLSSQLTKTVGNTFDLDMVEIKAGEDWESATFMVGKYITNNLFVTYQRGFGENEEESLTPQTITLEYEVTRNLFLRLTQGAVKDSGVDVILKFEKD
ncbi:translocation/assembly module TamB domain-containing protein, partial [Marinilabilia sp.]